MSIGLRVPFTFFAHQVVVLPFKWAKPRWFDGTALCVGSMAPDFAYAFSGTPLWFGSHTIYAQLFWTLPLTLAVTYGIRGFAAEALGSQLTEPLGSEVRALARSRPALSITVLSALLGGFSHILLDSFTHPHGWAFERFAVLRRLVVRDFSLAETLQGVGHTLGTAIGLAMFAVLVGKRCVSRWNGSSPLDAATWQREPWFWPCVFKGTWLCSLAALGTLLTGGSLPVAIIRASWVLAAALALAVVRLRLRGATQPRISTGF